MVKKTICAAAIFAISDLKIALGNIIFSPTMASKFALDKTNPEKNWRM